MRTLGKFVLTGPFQAVAVISGFALLSFLFPFLIILSGGALALIALEIGIREAIRVLVICVLVVGAIAYFLLGGITTGTLVVWVSVLAAAYLYRNFQSLSVVLQALTVFGVVVTSLAALLFPDLQLTWQNYLRNMLEAVGKTPSLQLMLPNPAIDLDRVQEHLPRVASVMTGVVVAVYLLTVSFTLFLGGWWHGLMANMNTFRKEFASLDLGLVLAAVTAVLGVAAWFMKAPVLWQLTVVCLSMFFLHGLGLAHALIGKLRRPVMGFILVYGLMFFAAPQVVLMLASAGVLDGLVNFRKRFAKSGL